MISDKSEQLVKILGPNNDHVTSTETDAITALEIIKETNSELYKYLLTEAKKRIDAEKVSETATGFENMVKRVEDNTPFWYRGEATYLHPEGNTIFGIIALTKVNVNSFGLWKIKVGNLWDDYAYFIKNGQTVQDYRAALIRPALHKGIYLPKSLLDEVFNPIDVRIMEMYQQLKG